MEYRQDGTGQDYRRYAVRQPSRGQKNPPPSRAQKKPKRVFKPDKDGIIALLALLLIAAVVITLIVFTVKAIVGKRPSETSGPASSSPENTQSSAWNSGFVTKPVVTDDMYKGDLILVNPDYAYHFPSEVTSSLSVVSLYRAEGYGINYVLGNDIRLSAEALPHMNAMFAEMHTDLPDTFKEVVGADGTVSRDQILVASGYRDASRQQSVYQSTIADMGPDIGQYYAAKPGYSEHHTGYAIDLKIFTAGRATVDFTPEQQQWMLDNCAKYGFVLRYDGSKFDITKILHETWHFRYVGTPHAAYMTEKNLCLEEYTDLLRNHYSYEQGPLSYITEGKEYQIYFYPADSGEAVTFLKVPASSSYTVSGNNVDGFIVTVAK
ncbi:MAG: M15 family metallopeptidase [Ruminococcus sp.]|nr:M15 family metallopeptidase [Candidatus Apopatosoma intestinale]